AQRVRTRNRTVLTRADPGSLTRVLPSPRIGVQQRTEPLLRRAFSGPLILSSAPALLLRTPQHCEPLEPALAAEQGAFLRLGQNFERLVEGRAFVELRKADDEVHVEVAAGAAARRRQRAAVQLDERRIIQKRREYLVRLAFVRAQVRGPLPGARENIRRIALLRDHQQPEPA